MTINRGALRTTVLDYADATGSRRWDASAGGSVDLRISGVFDRLWRRMLDANRFYRVAKRTPTADADGRYAVADLNGGLEETDTFQRFNRILTVIIDGAHYAGPEGLPEWALAGTDALGSPSGRIWYQEGTKIAAVPFQAGKVADAIWVNWIPQRPADFEDDNSVVDFPEGYEDVLAVHAAARLLMKGGAETAAARELRAEVEEDYQEMLQHVARISTNPLVMRQVDDASEWGSQ